MELLEVATRRGRAGGYSILPGAAHPAPNRTLCARARGCHAWRPTETDADRRRPMLPHALKNTLTFILAGGRGRAAQAADGAARQAGGALRRRLPDHRLHAQQLHPLGAAAHLRADAVPGALARGAHPLRLELPAAAPVPVHQRAAAAPPASPARGTRAPPTPSTTTSTASARRSPEHVLILSGDHIYKMDYGRMLRGAHRRTARRLTIGAVKIPAAESSRFGIFEIDAAGPRRCRSRRSPRQGPEIPGEPGWCLGSMGIYIFETEELDPAPRGGRGARPESSHDFGKDVIPRMIADVPTSTPTTSAPSARRDDRARPTGATSARSTPTTRPTWTSAASSRSSTSTTRDWPIYTLWHNDPPAKTVLDEGGRRAEVRRLAALPGRRSCRAARCGARSSATASSSTRAP